MAKLIVLCSPERLYARDNEAGGVWAIGLNLSVASEGQIDEKLLKPWKWPSLIGRMRVSVDAVAQAFDQNVEVLKWDHQKITVDTFQDARKAVTDYYDIVYAKTKSDFTPGQNTDMRADTSSWPAVIADLSQRPAPVPHFLNLCFYIRIPRGSVADGSVICVAPVLPAGILSGAGEAVPKDVPTGTDEIRKWSYTSPFAGIDIEAQTESIKLGNDPQLNGAFLDFKRLFVKQDATVQQFNEDWRPQVEQRLALDLDLSTQLINYLRLGKNVDLATANQIGAAAIAVMRDCAGAGVGRGPDGRAVLEIALGRAYQNSEKSQAESANQQAFSDSTEWRNALRKWLTILTSSGNNLPLLQGTQLDRAEIVRQLEKLHEVMLREDTLHFLLVAQWAKLRDAGATFITDSLPLPLELRLPLAYETVNSIWEDFRSGIELTNDRAAVLKALTSAISKYYKDRLSGKPRGLPIVSVPMPQDLQDLLDASAAALAVRAIPQQGDVLSITNVPHGITLQVDRVSSESSNDTTSQNDLLRRMRGVALLMRHGKGNWKSLNMASLCLQVPNKKDPKKLDLMSIADPVLVPTRVMYINGVGQPTITYNNDPQGAKSPLACATDVYLAGGTGEHVDCRMEPSAKPGDPPPLLVNEYSTSSLAGLMGLYFGRKPLALPFIVSSSGVIPPELTSDSPIQLRSDLDQIDEQQLTGYIRQLPEYLRRVKIGQIRTTAKQDSLPLVPDNVFPRGREVDPNVFGSELPVDSDDPHRERSLLLLVPGSQQHGTRAYRFFVRQPAIDLQTWDRHTGKAIDPNLRKLVWCYSYAGEQRNRLKGAAPATIPADLPRDLSVDDPALAIDVNGGTLRYFYVELKKDNSNHVASSPQWVTIPASTTVGFASVQSDPVTVTVNSGMATTLDCSVAGEIRVTVASGDLCHLQICATVHETNTKKFANVGTDWTWHFPSSKPPSGEKYALVSPLNLIIETATEKLPTARQLWDAMNISPDENGVFSEQDKLVVRCDTAPGSNDWGRYVCRIDVLKQVWQWSGRPVSRHPALRDSDRHAQDLDEWESEEFGARTESDHVVLPMARKAGLYEYREDFVNAMDLRGLHCRFRIRAYSRYAGILPAQLGFKESASKDSPPVLGDPGSNRWKSAFLPSRRLSDVPPVGVAFVVPMTAGNRASTKTSGADFNPNPGLMVLLKEPWYEVGGIGEELEAQVALTPDPSCPPETPGQPCSVHYYQHGPDPILNKFDPSNALTQEKNEVLFAKIEGPVGHTFDRPIGTQLFVKSSFVLPAPSITRGGKTNPADRLWWNFSRVRFRRKIVLPGKAGPVYSAFTPDFWVQYLPDFSIFETGSTGISDLTLAIESGNLKLLDETHAPKPMDSESKQFGLFMFLTRHVFDATGSQGQEEFVGIYRQNGTVWSPLTGSPPASVADLSRYRARIVELQAHPGSSGVFPSYSTVDEFWTCLLDNQDGQSRPISDVRRARIVRISEPIDSAESKASRCWND